MTPILVSVILISLLILIFIRLFLWIVTVTGSSMVPTLVENDRVLVVRHWPDQWLREKQIVICNLAKVEAIPAPRPSQVIKRITGLPETSLKIHAAELEEGVMCYVSALGCDQDGYYTVAIPAKHYFLWADGHGSDSRLWGPIPAHAVRGVVIAKLRPNRGTGDQ